VSIQAEQDVQYVREKMEDYRTTISALQCLIGLLTWDSAKSASSEDARFSLGRRMQTSAKNAVSPDSEVTPDAVVQVSPTLGHVIEAKKTLPAQSKNDPWARVVRQLAKYDDDLAGWWTDTEQIAASCVVLLLHITRAVEFHVYLEKSIQGGAVAFTRPVSIIEFARSSEGKEFLFLRKHWGDILHPQVLPDLEKGRNVPLEDLLATYGEKKFYDSPPITEYTMAILWLDVFNELKAEVEQDEQEKAWLLDVTVEQLTSDLQRLYGSIGNAPREVEFPKAQWIRDAMEAFVRLRLARKRDGRDEYTVLFKRLPGDIVERFASHHGDLPSSEPPPQLSLF
jgi:hypothetical protein